MIQRIQSIFYFAGALCVALMYFFDMAIVYNNPLNSEIIQDITVSSKGMLYQQHAPTLQTVYESTDSIFINVLMAGIVLLLVAAIFQYNNRKLQIKIGNAGIALLLGLLGSIAAITYRSVDQYFADGFKSAQFKPGIALILPVIAVVLVILANRAVKKDEDLVRSADRIR